MNSTRQTNKYQANTLLFETDCFYLRLIVLMDSNFLPLFWDFGAPLIKSQNRFSLHHCGQWEVNRNEPTEAYTKNGTFPLVWASYSLLLPWEGHVWAACGRLRDTWSRAKLLQLPLADSQAPLYLCVDIQPRSESCSWCVCYQLSCISWRAAVICYSTTGN